MKDLTLVVMAAGMGSRFGGLKQIEPVGPNGEIIADYSVYDAINAGFTKVIFIIRKENLDYFKENITKKFVDKIKVEFAFQELDLVPKNTIIPDSRIKMLGTGHALYCARHLIDGDFAIINSDDFYGYDAFKVMVDYLITNSNNNEYVTVNYPVGLTCSKNGTVKRGVCFTKDGYVEKTIESVITLDKDILYANPLDGSPSFEIAFDQPVCVNCFAFRNSFLDLLSQEFLEFINNGIDDTNEFLLTDIIKNLTFKGQIKGVAKCAKSKWMGVTYKEDLEEFKENILKLIEEGEYPNQLWM